jgi:uncharacterized protein YqgV (UPF0045/DUF77 family)
MLRVVDAVIAYLKSLNLNLFVSPFESTIEGSFDEVMKAAAEAQRICIREGAGSVSTYMKVFYSPTTADGRGGVLSTEEKTAKYARP